MTKDALSKLNKTHLDYCNMMSALIEVDRKYPHNLQYENDSGKLNGYLECLKDMNVITETERKLLYLWFSTENRDEKIKRIWEKIKEN